VAADTSEENSDRLSLRDRRASQPRRASQQHRSAARPPGFCPPPLSHVQQLTLNPTRLKPPSHERTLHHKVPARAKEQTEAAQEDAERSDWLAPAPASVLVRKQRQRMGTFGAKRTN
jgi:hypothetical protein